MANENLQKLLKANGYADVDHEAVSFAPHLADLSKPMIRRVKALKKNQLESLQIEARFYQRVHELEMEFQPLFDMVNAKRREIVAGTYEPNDEEAELPLLHGVPSEELEKIESEAPMEGGEQSKGIPGFWYNTLNSVGQISDLVKEYDQPILKYLMDITTEVHYQPAGFTLRFHFAENPYFANTVLTKYYQLDIGVDPEEPFEYDGPTVVKGEGSGIDWKEGKNVTQKIVKKKQKKGPQAGKFTTKTVSNESFFNFFDAAPKTLDEEDDELLEKVREDFEIGQIIRDQLIPRAVLFYTGEAADDEEDFDIDDEDEEDEEEEVGDEVSDEDEEEE